MPTVYSLPKHLTQPSTVPERLDFSFVSPVYHNLSAVFSKQQALSLPPHHLYNCTINLLPGALLTSGHLCNLSHPVRNQFSLFLCGGSHLQLGRLNTLDLT